VFIYGTDNMSTQDILGYFRAYGPSRLEWIDDSSCNVVWEESNSAKRTLLAIGEVICEVITDPDDFKQQSNEPGLEKGNEHIGKDQKIDNRRQLSDTCDSIVCPISPPASTQKSEASPEPQPDTLPSFEADQQEVDYWRLGRSHPKAKFLLLRQTRTGDKKVVGASQKSRYYLLHGNPNKPGNPKGLSVKEIRRRKYKRKIRKKHGGTDTAVEIMEVEEEDSNSETEPDMVMSEITSRHGNKRRSRLRMHADDVEKGLDSIPMEVDLSSQTVPVPASGLPQDDLRHRLSAPVIVDDLRVKLQQRQQAQVGVSKIKVTASLEQDSTDREVLMV
jgi:hypothetical protein